MHYRKQEYLVDEKCLTRNFIYKVTVKTEKGIKNIHWLGFTFEHQFIKHKYSVKHEKHYNPTTLSQFI